MKIIFDNYYRYYPNNDNRIYNATLANSNNDTFRNTYKFNENVFRDFLSKGRYEDAAIYAEQFHFMDKAKNDEHKRNIAKLRREGEERNALKNKLAPEDYRLYSIGMAINNTYGIKDLLSPNINRMNPNKSIGGPLAPYNTYAPNSNIADKLVTDLNRLGSTVNKDGTLNYASSLSVTFEPGVQKRWGVSWLDWAKADNPNTAKAYYERLGMSEDELRKNGIEIIHEDGDAENGKTTIKFSKSNPLAFKLLSKLYDKDVNRNSWGGIPETVTGYDDNGKELGKERVAHLAQNQGVSNLLPLLNTLNKAQDMVEHVNTKVLGRTKKDGYANLRVGPLMTNEIYTAQKLYQEGKLTDEQYKYDMAIAQQHMFEILASIPNNQKMYSNFNNEEKNDESLQELDNTSRSELQRYISYNLDKRPDKITLQTAVQDGTYGVLVTINAHEKEDNTDTDIDERRIQVFMPGLQSDTVQEIFDNDPASRAVTEINSIKDYGYKYKLSDGETIQANVDGTFNLTNKGQNITIDQKYAEQKIHESILIDDAKHEIVDTFLTKNGTIRDVEGYRNMAKLFAIKTANEIYADLPEIGTNTQSSIYSAEEVFNEAKVNDKNTQYEMWNKIIAARNMYELLLKELSNYM